MKKIMLLALFIPVIALISGCETQEDKKLSPSSNEIEGTVINVGDFKNTRNRSIEVLPGHDLKLEGEISNEEKKFIYEVLKTFKSEDRKKFENELFSEQIDPNKVSRLAGAYFRKSMIDRPDFYLVGIKKVKEESGEVENLSRFLVEIKYISETLVGNNLFDFTLINENGKIKLYDAPGIFFASE